MFPKQTTATTGSIQNSRKDLIAQNCQLTITETSRGSNKSWQASFQAKDSAPFAKALQNNELLYVMLCDGRKSECYVHTMLGNRVELIGNEALH